MITNLETLKSQSIVGVIERYIRLRKNGANFIACCPFHSEKSPSFVVSEAKGLFKCFGCGKGGDALSFIKEYERIDFNEAVKRLSELTGIALEYDSTKTQPKSPSEVLEKINALAKQSLAQNAQILAYLQERGLTREICERYDIGLVPSKQELLQHFSARELVESGFANEYSALGKHSSDSKDFGTTADSCSAPKSLESTTSPTASPRILQEKQANAQNISIPMHHRICIAIRNPQHKIVAFVARTHPHYNFPPNAPKYINSKESYFYKKAQILYLLSHARAAITQTKAAFIVEGYIDSILLHENGYKNALATGGTAFNLQHLNLLTKLDCEVIFCFDNDKSGMAANFRAVKVCFNAGFYRVRVAILQVRDEKGRLCKDINEALMASALGKHSSDSKDFGTTADHQSSSAPKSLESTTSPTANLRILEKEKQTSLDQNARNLNETPKDSRIFDEKSLLCEQAQGSYLSGNDRRACEAIKDLSQKAESTSEKLKFKYLSGYEFFIKWLYKNKDKQQAFNEIKAAINACQNFYDKQEFLESACKLTGVPSEYFTQDKLPTKQPKDDYSKLVASVLHSEECAYIASELDLSFLPAQVRGSLQVFIEQLEAVGKQTQGKLTPKELAEFIEVEPLDSDSFYLHYCDLYLAHLHREQTKAKAKKDLNLVLALSEKITQVQQDIQAQKAF
ncbi:DNA primase [Helicobacter canis]|uniref:DNA primase n=1 Tax=Helicobacter canis NCTC 12740 TaxID=1357399 RepID=V8CJT4_9HELI|nr:CHC2 zinc finger domain-containing protein [Helicobacter canis]ETD27352.1 DNA primase [Helicobacter canis NCTC 12740]